MPTVRKPRADERMETITLRVPKSTAAALSKIGPTVSKQMDEFVRAELQRMADELERNSSGLTPESKALGVPETLEAMASTFRERNKVYGDNWRMVGRLMAVMFPDGVKLKAAQDYDVWHLFELMIVKLSRFAIGRLEHEDSIHDLAVYAAMIEAILKQRREQKQP